MKTNLLAGLVVGGAMITTLAVTPEVNALPTMDGSIAFGAFGATVVPNNISLPNLVITPFAPLAGTVVVSPNSGVFADGDFLEVSGPAAIFVSTSAINLAAGTFTFSDAVFGSWVTTSIANIAFNPITTTLSFNIFGTFTPGTLYPGFDPGAARIAVSLTQTGGPNTPVSWSATLTSPPFRTAVPEPMTAGLGLLSLGALGAFATRRRQA